MWNLKKKGQTKQKLVEKENKLVVTRGEEGGERKGWRDLIV